jgi:voltage-gated potassium channel
MSAQAPSVPVSEVAPRQKFILAYEKRTSIWLSFLALVYLFTFSIQSIWPDIEQPWNSILIWFSGLLWLLFALDLLFRFLMTTQKRGFFKRNWLDTLTVVVPQLRALRALRAFTQNGILSKGKGFFSGGALASAGIGMIIIVWVGSLSVLDAERGAPNADIENLGEAVWWMFETISTVGYGDFVPVTDAGRSIAVLIMFVGVSLMGVISAGLAATLLKQNQPDPAKAVMDELADLKKMVGSLQEQLANQTKSDNSPQP